MESGPVDNSYSSWCEISASSLRTNLEQVRAHLAANTLLGVVVKSNAYGHGIVAVSDLASASGADWLIVNSISEAVTLRDAGITLPLYVCGPILPAQVPQILDIDARVVVSDAEVLKAIIDASEAAKQPVKIHLKLETGTHRQGIPLSQLLPLAQRIALLPYVEFEGLTTHYADIEDTTEHEFAMGQLKQLQNAEAELASLGTSIPIVHSANSAATLIWPETHGGLVRVGIAAYGLWPSRETYATALQSASEPTLGYVLPQLNPVLSWRTRISHINQVPAGDYVGYGRTFRATYPMRMAVLPVGYFEGYRRALSNAAHVLIHGVRAPVRGRICMNMCMVDVTHIPDAKVNDVATLVGSQGDEAVSIEQLAEWAGTINYEMVTAIHSDQPRLVVQ
jgi:alanine racemase